MENKLTKIENYLLVFTLVDILFAPYVFFIATTYSQLFVFLWFLNKKKVAFERIEIRFYYGIIFFIAISTFISLFTIPYSLVSEYFFDNIKRGLNIIMGISYYFFFTYIFKTRDRKIEKWMFAFLLYITLWGVMYYSNMGLFLTLKRMFNPYDSVTGVFLNNSGFFNRFNFIWTDPNNVSYTVVGVVSFLIINKRTSNLTILLSFLAMLFILLITMSGGGIISALIILPLSIIVRLRVNRNMWNHSLFIVSALIAILLVSKFSSKFLGGEIGEIAISRIEEKNETEEPRLRIWKKLFDEKNVLHYIVAGEGSNLFVQNRRYAPHSGHFMFIFGFGFVCYYMYMYTIFRKSKSQRWTELLYIVPFFLCFTINIGIGELKYAAIMYMLIAYSRVQNRVHFIENKSSEAKRLQV